MRTIVHAQIERCIKAIRMRNIAEGGFAEHPGGSYRPDATAWAILTLAKINHNDTIVEPARNKLATSQLKDRRVCMPGNPGSYWPTSLAVLAWQGSTKHREAQSRALRFILETSGEHWKKKPDSPVAHDTSIPGWPWTENTHSFVEPTALALFALEMSGQSGRARFQEGARMLMNRQLPHGGWNYGNTLVYGQELHPFIDTTGLALNAIAGHVKKEDVNLSIQLLKNKVEQCRTPLSLGWALFGLGAWGEFPKKGHVWIEESLKRQNKYGAYPTSLLSLLVIASICQGDFRKCFA